MTASELIAFLQTVPPETRQDRIDRGAFSKGPKTYRIYVWDHEEDDWDKLPCHEGKTLLSLRGAIRSLRREYFDANILIVGPGKKLKRPW